MHKPIHCNRKQSTKREADSLDLVMFLCKSYGTLSFTVFRWSKNIASKLKLLTQIPQKKCRFRNATFSEMLVNLFQGKKIYTKICKTFFLTNSFLEKLS